MFVILWPRPPPAGAYPGFLKAGVGGRGGGGDSNMKMPRCVCQESDNVPILNDTFSW